MEIFMLEMEEWPIVFAIGLAAKDRGHIISYEDSKHIYNRIMETIKKGKQHKEREYNTWPIFGHNSR